MVSLFMNFVRLTDKAFREYDAGRAELLVFLEPSSWPGTAHYLRAVDHMENCVSAAHRAVLHARALREKQIGRAGPRLTQIQFDRLKYFRNAVEHSEEKLLGDTEFKKSSAFGARDPFSIRPSNKALSIGDHVLTYKELVSAIQKCHKTVEVIRGVPTGDPGPSFPNAKLRTDTGTPVQRAGTARTSDYLRELSRLVITH